MRHRPISDLIDPIMADPESRAEVEAIRRAMRDVIALAKLREDRQLTQQAIADVLNVSQANVSRIEHEEDVYLSTLRAYVAALGGELEINAVFPDGKITLVAAKQEPVPAGS